MYGGHCKNEVFAETANSQNSATHMLSYIYVQHEAFCNNEMLTESVFLTNPMGFKQSRVSKKRGIRGVVVHHGPGHEKSRETQKNKQHTRK